MSSSSTGPPPLSLSISVSTSSPPQSPPISPSPDASVSPSNIGKSGKIHSRRAATTTAVSPNGRRTRTAALRLTDNKEAAIAVSPRGGGGNRALSPPPSGSPTGTPSPRNLASPRNGPRPVVSPRATIKGESKLAHILPPSSSPSSSSSSNSSSSSSTSGSTTSASAQSSPVLGAAQAPLDRPSRLTVITGGPVVQPSAPSTMADLVINDEKRAGGGLAAVSSLKHFRATKTGTQLEISPSSFGGGVTSAAMQWQLPEEKKNDEESDMAARVKELRSRRVAGIEKLLSEEQRAEFAETFSEFDIDGDGTISATELDMAMSMLGIKIPDYDRKNLMAESKL
jgi:hypothetical protein